MAEEDHGEKEHYFSDCYIQTANIDLSRTDLIAFRFLKEIKKESFLRLVGCVTKPFGKTSVKLAHNDHDNNKKTVFFQ